MSVFERFDSRYALNATPLTVGYKSHRLTVEEPKVSFFLSLGANAVLSGAFTVEGSTCESSTKSRKF
jgi:hypothetical protein